MLMFRKRALVTRLAPVMLSLTGIGVLTSCKVGPDYQLPDPPVTEQFAPAEDDRVQAQPDDHTDWRQRKSHFPARVWDSRETYFEVGRRDIRDLARSP